ncbi:universal stress protein [Limibaculum sp. M0105]|uniref:Universal stress protein n=1 Tax=Thermohalobaculum xanthum TaxID=2753746 RepID=A0A8J7M942_9RHOB|nr:universal stress protein [Thermohalobaculum xanthum]MBK0400418.1 universal stress protein [Thermohalobaculum xanthum]
MFERILVPIDGSEQSFRAIDTAAGLARKFDGALTLVCVYRHHSPLEASLSMVRARPAETPDSALKDHAAEVLRAGKSRAAEAGAERIEAFAQRGQPAREIVAFAERIEADAIVMGSRGLGDVEGFLLGSVSHKVGSLSPVTCVLVK